MKQRVRYPEAAKYLGIPEGTLRAKVCRKEVPHYRLGGRLVLFDLADLDSWLAGLRVGGGQTP